MTIVEVMVDLVVLSKEHPKLELRLTLKNGCVQVGIPKGPEGNIIEQAMERYKGELLIGEMRRN